jgi:hypothetical protein
MTPWPAAGLLLLAALLHFTAPVSRRRWVTVILYFAAATVFVRAWSVANRPAESASA